MLFIKSNNIHSLSEPIKEIKFRSGPIGPPKFPWYFLFAYKIIDKITDAALWFANRKGVK